MSDRPFTIAVTGSFSTGKSTLVRAIAETLDDTHDVGVVDEVARQLIAAAGSPSILQKGATPFPMELWIIAKQIQLEADALAARPEVLIVDRGIIDAWAYIQVKYAGQFGAIEGRLFENLVIEHARRYDLVVHVPIEFGIDVDDVRDDDIAFQAEIDAMLRQLWRRAGVASILVKGSVEERVQQVLDALPHDLRPMVAQAPVTMRA